MNKEVIFSGNAPAAIGPYSQGIKAQNFAFVSGQLPVDPASGSIPDDIQAQTHQSIKNLQAILQSVGGDLGSIVKTTVFIKNMENFSKINEVYAQYFKDAPPARSLVEVARLPKDAQIEIECIALI